jgi:hypothetical protein
VSSKLAERSRGWAAEIREQVAAAGDGSSTTTGSTATGATTTATADTTTATDIAREVAEDNPPL